MQIISLTSATSLMDELLLPQYASGEEVVVLTAHYQTAGRGQGTHLWHSAPGENLLLGILWPHPPYAVGEQHLLSLHVADAVCRTLAPLLAPHGLSPWVKPPNDIWVNQSKIAGLLIEHDVQGTAILRTRIGIGLNVNEADFPACLPNPCSLRTLTGRTFSRADILGELLSQLAF